MNAERSIGRALPLLHSASHDEYFIVKLSPQPRTCCCSDCWPDTWHAVNKAIAPAQAVPHEGDSLLWIEGISVVLESHESGPEIVLLMAEWAKSMVALVKPISDIVMTFVQSLRRERPKGIGKLRLESYRVIEGVETRVGCLDMEFPLDQATISELNTSIQKLLKEGIAKPDD